MAVLITFLGALILLGVIWRYDRRFAAGRRQPAGRATLTASPAQSIADLPQDIRYETALATARAIIHQFADRADMPEHERLAGVTYSILSAMNRHEERHTGPFCPEPSVN